MTHGDPPQADNNKNLRVYSTIQDHNLLQWSGVSDLNIYEYSSSKGSQFFSLLEGPSFAPSYRILPIIVLAPGISSTFHLGFICFARST